MMLLSAMPLGCSCAMFGTGISYATATCIAYAAAMLLCISYAVSGPGQAYAATPRSTISSTDIGDAAISRHGEDGEEDEEEHEEDAKRGAEAKEVGPSPPGEGGKEGRREGGREGGRKGGSGISAESGGGSEIGYGLSTRGSEIG
eukprot:244081-Rhodomonas_salina.2